MKHLIIIYLLICLDTKLVRANNLQFEIIKNPASTNSSSSNLTSFGEEFILSWIELDSKKTARLKMSVWNGLRFDKNILIEFLFYLTINFSKNNILCPNNSNNVGNHMTFTHHI